MDPLRRTTTPSPLPLALELPHICDQCGQPRNKGKHQRCSRRRQALNAHKWEK